MIRATLNSAEQEIPTRKAIYDVMQLTGRSDGFRSIVIPLLFLIAQYRCRFGKRLMDELQKGNRYRPPNELLEEYGFSDAIWSLGTYYPAQKSALKLADWSASALQSFYKKALILATSPDEFRSGVRKDYQVLEEQAREQLREDVRVLLVNILQSYSTAATADVVHYMTNVIRRLREQSVQPVLSSDRRTGLVNAIAALRKYPRGWMARSFGRLKPKRSCRWLLSSTERSSIERDVKAIEEAAQIIADSERASSERRLWDWLSGNAQSGQIGIIEKIFSKLVSDVSISDLTQRHLEEHVHAVSRLQSKQPTEDWVVSDIDDELDPITHKRVEDCLDQLARDSGRDAHQLSLELWQEESALEIKGRRLTPPGWAQERPADVVNAIRQRIDHYIGYSIDGFIDWVQPVTMVDHLGRFHFGHPELGPKIEQSLFDAVRRSHPFLEVPTIATRADGEECIRPQLLVYAHPMVRPMIAEMLSNQGKLIGGRGASMEFGINHPYRVNVYQGSLGLPLFAQRSLIQGQYQLAKLRGATGFKLADQDDDSIVVCVLAERGDGEEDSRQLFEALLICRDVKRLEDRVDRYSLVNPSPGAEAMFHDQEVINEPRPASFFKRQLSENRRFQDLILFRGRDATKQQLEQLKAYHDVEKVAEELVGLGILQPVLDTRLYRIALTDVPRREMPPQMTSIRVGRLRGMAREQFVSELVDNDLFYNECFWRVIFAFARRQIELHEMPDYAAKCAAELDRMLWLE